MCARIRPSMESAPCAPCAPCSGLPLRDVASCGQRSKPLARRLRMTPAGPVLISLDARRLVIRAMAEEPAARAEGRFVEFALELQALACAGIANTVFLRFAEHLPALRRADADVMAQFQQAIRFTLETFRADAVRTAAEHGLTPADGERLAQVGAQAFIARMNAVLSQAQEIGRA